MWENGVNCNNSNIQNQHGCDGQQQTCSLEINGGQNQLNETTLQQDINSGADIQLEQSEEKTDGILENQTPNSSPNPPKFSDTSLEQIRVELDKFAVERNWTQFHTPRNLLLALMGEVGELAEQFQWKGEVSPGLPGLSAEDKQAVQEEIADVMLYLVRFADMCGVDLTSAVFQKMQKNAKKYPSHLCRGSSAKYTAYEATPEVQQQEQQKEQQQQQESESAPTVLPMIEDGGSSPTAGIKRKRFTDEQVQEMRNLAIKANWSMAGLSKEEKEDFCNKWDVPKDKLQNFFNNRKPKGFKRGLRCIEGEDSDEIGIQTPTDGSPQKINSQNENIENNS